MKLKLTNYSPAPFLSDSNQFSWNTRIQGRIVQADEIRIQLFNISQLQIQTLCTDKKKYKHTHTHTW